MELQQLTIKGINKELINITYWDLDINYIALELTNYENEPFYIKVHSSLFAVLISILQRVLLKWDGVVLITGDVGDGKSTIAQLISTIWEHFFSRVQTLELIVWTSENFTTQIEREDNETSCILWDEAIQGGTGRDTITKQGQALKKAFVTKRYKRHLYLLLVDEIQEYNKKIISRTRAWIHVYTKGLERGYFDVYTNKTQIRRMYRKIKKYDLEIEEVMNSERCQYTGYQPNTSDMFYDRIEYQKRKQEETNKEDEKVNDKDAKVINQRNKLIAELNKLGMKQKDISALIQLNKVSVSTIIKEQNEKLVS